MGVSSTLLCVTNACEGECVIHFYQQTSLGLERRETLQAGCWVWIESPTEDNLQVLRTRFGIPDRFVTHVLDLDELARYETSGSVELIVLRIPYHLSRTPGDGYKTTALSILLIPDHIITVCNHPAPLLEKLTGLSRGDAGFLRPERFVLYALLATAEDFLSQLGHLKAVLEVAEDKLSVAQRNQELFVLLKLQKSLVYFTTGLNSNALLLDQLRQNEHFEMLAEDHELLNQVVIETMQAVEITTITEGILSQMMDAFASIISNNLNVVMKFLAAITIVLSLPTMVASIYGMNVLLPMQDSPAAFPILMVLSLGVSAAVGYIFWRRRWM